MLKMILLKESFSFLLVFLLPLHLLRFEFWGFSTNLWEGAVFLIFLWSWFWGKGRVKKKLPGLFWLALILIALGILGGFLLAEDKLVAGGIIKGWFVIPFLFAWALRSLSVGPSLFAGLASLIGFLSLLSGGQFLSGEFITLDGRVSALYSSANLLAMVLLPSSLLLLGWTGRSALKIGPKFFFFFISALGLAAVILTRSTGALLALAAALAFWLWLLWRQRAVWWIGLLLLGGGFSLLVKLSGLKVNSSSVLARWQIWQTAWQLIERSFPLGIGWGDFLKNYQLAVGQLFAQPLELLVPHAHSFFLQTQLSLGLIGLLGFLLLLGIITKRLWRSALWVLPALGAWFLQGLFDTTYYHQALAALFWLFVVLAF